MRAIHSERVGEDIEEPRLLDKSNRSLIEHWIYKGMIICGVKEKDYEEKPYLYKIDIPGFEFDSIDDVIYSIDEIVGDLVHCQVDNAMLTPYGRMYKAPCGVRIIANIKTDYHPFLSENYNEITCGFCRIIAKEKIEIEARKRPVI
jgi:hypothetical protein